MLLQVKQITSMLDATSCAYTFNKICNRSSIKRNKSLNHRTSNETSFIILKEDHQLSSLKTFRNCQMLFKFKLLLFIIFLLLLIHHIESKVQHHHRRLFPCNNNQRSYTNKLNKQFLIEQCPIHKHKICGSDGKLYPSRCHLRRASCLTNTVIKPAHPDQCLQDDDLDDQQLQQQQQQQDIDQQLAPKTYDQIVSTSSSSSPSPLPPSSSFYVTESSTAHLNKGTIKDDSVKSKTDIDEIVYDKGDEDTDDGEDGGDPEEDLDGEECHPKQYDLMKERILEKINDVSLLFARLDENSDGKITLNELWKHSMIYKSPESASSTSAGATTSSPCLLTDLMQHEDIDDDDRLDFSEFQSAFNKLFSISMATLDETLSINRIEAHLGDNVEIRCDITGEPQKPAIKWFRHGVDLSTLNLPMIKVFNDGSLYLTDLKLSFSGNYSCQAVNNPTVKQIHIVDVIVDPIVEVTPRFQWTPIGGVASFECRFETFADEYEIHWFKNDELLSDSEKVTIINNGTLLQVAALEQTDTGAYTCRIIHRNGASGQSVASLLVQDDSVESTASGQIFKQELLWIFHANGLTIYKGVCGQTIHEIDSRDIIFQNGLTLCGSGTSFEVSNDIAVKCEWSDDVVHLNGFIYIAQPNLNRILVFHEQQLNVVEVLATDPKPRKLRIVENSGRDPQIWILCDGNNNYFVDEQSQSTSDYYNNEKSLKNRKTIQVIRFLNHTLAQNRFENGHHNAHHQMDVIHLQPVDGHFDLVYDFFIPDHYESIFKKWNMDDSILKRRLKSVMYDDAPYAYATHWEERSLVKIDIDRMEYRNSIRLADCQPIAASIITRRAGGLVSVQCQTPITHQLNGQLILDQITDAILIHNSHLNAHHSYLSPDHRYLISIYQDFTGQHQNILDQMSNQTLDSSWLSRSSGSHQPKQKSTNTSTIIVQKINSNGIEFLYDVRTSLNIVQCKFVWKNGVYDLVLASGTPNREDLLYLSLNDGHVELISGIGRPTQGYHRGMALSKNRVLSVTATESVFTVDLASNRILCESHQHFQRPRTLIWTN